MNEPTPTSATTLTAAPAQMGTPKEVFRTFLKLGLTSFGGPIAHLGYFRDELVLRRRWIDETGYADLVALCQFLPGPASSQVGFALGLLRGGPLGALAAWAAFTLPSALLLVVFALTATAFTGPLRQSCSPETRDAQWQALERRGIATVPQGPRR
jgi:chromate transporter